jgi:hypothetical protein
MQSENTIGAAEEFARLDAIKELQLPADDLDVVASGLTDQDEECPKDYCPKNYCAKAYQS